MPDLSKELDRAAMTIVGLIRMIEEAEEAGAGVMELTYEIELAGGAVELWTIIVRRKSS